MHALLSAIIHYSRLRAWRKRILRSACRNRARRWSTISLSALVRFRHIFCSIASLLVAVVPWLANCPLQTPKLLLSTVLRRSLNNNNCRLYIFDSLNIVTVDARPFNLFFKSHFSGPRDFITVWSTNVFFSTPPPPAISSRLAETTLETGQGTSDASEMASNFGKVTSNQGNYLNQHST